jgi:hypothetical protein
VSGYRLVRRGSRQIERLPGAARLEETWTTGADDGERAAFLDAIADIVESDSHCTVVLVMRADYVGGLADQPVHRAF